MTPLIGVVNGPVSEGAREEGGRSIPDGAPPAVDRALADSLPPTGVRLKDIAAHAGIAIPSILYLLGSRTGQLRDVSTVLSGGAPTSRERR